MAENIILVLAAGPNVGLHVAKHFSTKGYKTALVARNPGKDIIEAADLVVKADFSGPKGIKAVFKEVKEKLGVPNVVVYNGVFFECSVVHYSLIQFKCESLTP
jgi:NAD(P)-dependent dehydrogenase (short-subunit alcohol dehydrogenase family)